MENQLKEQGAEDKFDEVLKEIPRVREDLGFIPLVTPTSQIVGTQSVLNVLTGERYKSITKETAGVLKGEYGATAAPVNAELQLRVLDGADPITCRPADLLNSELDELEKELVTLAHDDSIELAKSPIDDVLTYALFPQVGLKFLKNRNNPDAFEPEPGKDEAEAPEDVAPAARKVSGPSAYSVRVDGKVYQVEVAESGALSNVKLAAEDFDAVPQKTAVSGNETLNAPLTGTVFKIKVRVGDQVNQGDVVIIMEAMKMETEVRAVSAGTITDIHIKEGDSVQTGEVMLSLG
jgi:oxaloacetate decarboxylase alpha subunit